MPIIVDTDVMLLKRKMSVDDLATLCEALNCQPCDLLRWETADSHA